MGCKANGLLVTVSRHDTGKGGMVELVVAGSEEKGKDEEDG